MDKTKAAELQRLLLIASHALHEAGAGLNPDDRAIFGRPIAELAARVHFDLLDVIYDHHPDLRPPPEPPMIDSELQWQDVTLPASMSEADLDQIILSRMTSRFQKTAMVIGKAVTSYKQVMPPIGTEILQGIIGARLQALAKAGRIESAGDLRYWRHSEVKLRG